MNNVHFSSKSDEWSTPQDLFDGLNSIWNFTMDVCADITNTKCNLFFDKEQDALRLKWNGVCFCNPPYSEVKLWIKKAYESSLEGTTVVMLIPARTDTVAWHTYIFPYAEIEFIKGRLKFGGHKNSAPFPSAIVVFRGKS